MAFKYTELGLQITQEDVINKQIPGDYIMVLYTGKSGDPLTVVESTAPGYSQKTMTGVNWTVATNGDATYPKIQFILTGAGTPLIGYGIERDGSLIGYEDFTDGPYDVPSQGVTVAVEFKQTIS